MMLTRASLQSGLLLVAIAGSALPLSSAGQARSPFDGRWSIEAVADPSRCSVRYTVAVQVANGEISGAYFGAIARGAVDSNGKLILRIDVVRATGGACGQYRPRPLEIPDLQWHLDRTQSLRG